jgi:hypothetical protein
MKTTLHLENAHAQALPAAFQEEDVRYPESLVEHFLREYTQVGDNILDPFAGFGTTLMVAERMERVPFGIEINPEKVSYVRGKLSQPEGMLQGDARSLAGIDLPVIALLGLTPFRHWRNWSRRLPRDSTWAGHGL